MRIKLANIRILLMMLASIFALSPIFNNLIPIPSNILSAASCILVVLLSIGRGLQLKFVYIILIVFVVLSSILFSIYWGGHFKLLAYPIYFVLSIFAVSSLTFDEKIKLTSHLTNVLLVIVLGAVIGFMYALLGGDPILTILNPDGRESKLFLTTMTNWNLGNIIRPSGIFDEPGALSFVICFICANRHIMKLSRNKTWFLLLGGLVTLSMAHVIYIACHAVAERIKPAQMVKFVIVIALLTIPLSMSPKTVDAFDAYLFARFEIVDGRVAGDNRTELLENAFDLLDERSFFWGISSDCIVDIDACNSKYSGFGENFLSLLALTGIGPSLPYYIAILYLGVVGITRKSRLVLFGAALLLLQRPYIMTYGYASLICLLVSAAYDYFNENVLQKNYGD